MKKRSVQFVKKFISAALVATILITTGNVQMTALAATKAKKIVLNYTTRELVVGQKLKLKVDSIKPNKASKAVTWKSSKTSVATVSSKGVVKAKKKGTTTITAISKSNKKVTAKCKISVLSYKTPSLTLVEETGTWQCGKSLLTEKWKEIYPYICKYMGEPEKISSQGIIWSWDDAIDYADKVDYKADTNTVYVGPLPHHRNFADTNHYNYEPFVWQLMHETGHMFNQQGTDIVNYDFGQWAWEATTMVAENEYFVDVYQEYNRHQEPTLDLVNLCGNDGVNGVFYDGNKYSREIVDTSSRAAFFYMSTVLSTKGTYDYWRKVNTLRMEWYKTSGKTSIDWGSFAGLLDKVAGSKRIDGKKASEWLKSQAVSNIDGEIGDYLIIYPMRPADSWPQFYVGCFNRYIDENGTKKENPYEGQKVSITVENAAGKKVTSGTATIDGSGYVLWDKGSLDSFNLKNNTTLRVIAETTINGTKHTATTYQTYVKGNADSDYKTTYVQLINSDGKIQTGIKSSDVKITGASTSTTSALSRGTLILKGLPGSTYKITYKGKTYTISQPECRRVYPLVLK